LLVYFINYLFKLNF